MRTWPNGTGWIPRGRDLIRLLNQWRAFVVQKNQRECGLPVAPSGRPRPRHCGREALRFMQLSDVVIRSVSPDAHRNSLPARSRIAMSTNRDPEWLVRDSSMT